MENIFNPLMKAHADIEKKLEEAKLMYPEGPQREAYERGLRAALKSVTDQLPRTYSELW